MPDRLGMTNSRRETCDVTPGHFEAVKPDIFAAIHWLVLRAGPLEHVVVVT